MTPVNFLLNVVLNRFFSFALFAFLIGVCVADFYLCVNGGILRRGYPQEFETGLNVTCQIDASTWAMMIVWPQLKTTELFFEVARMGLGSSIFLRSSLHPKLSRYLLQNSSVQKVRYMSNLSILYFVKFFDSCVCNSALLMILQFQLMKIIEAKQDRKSLPTRGLKGNTATWLDQKKTRDSQLWGCDTSKYWIVQNKLYDLNQYAKTHPGGQSWLTMTRGQDVTDLFIVHHLNEAKARAILEKYYVGETANKVSRFTYEENGLYRTIKRRVLERLSIKEIQSETVSKIYGCIFLAFFLVALIVTAKSIDMENPSNMTYLYAAIAAFQLIGIVGIAHNFVHHKSNLFKYFFVLTGFTHNQWQIMHCISHHMYPNTELDYEAAALEPIAYFLRVLPPNKIYTELVVVVLMTFVQPLNFIIKLCIVPLIKRKLPEFWYLVPLSVFALFYFYSGDLQYALKLHIFLYAFYGLVFNRVLFCGHRVAETWTEGAQRIEDFAEHTVYSTSDTDSWIKGFFSYYLLAGLNMHVPHHLFPTADVSALPKLMEIIDEVCQEKGVKQIRNSRIQCFASLSKGIYKRVPFEKK